MAFKNPLAGTWYERVGLFFMAALIALIWILSTGMFANGADIQVHWLANLPMPAIWLFWISIAIFHVGLFLVATRSLIHGTHNTVTDSIFLGVGIIGMILIVISLVAFRYFGFGSVPWFFNIQQYTVFWVGLLMEVSTMLYYGLTE